MVTPDGRYLLAAAGDLRVISLSQEAQIASIPLGGPATQILVEETSTTAYVLTSGGNQILVVDLIDMQLETALDVNGVTSIALTTDSSRILAASSTEVRQFRTRDFRETTASFDRPNIRLINATLHVFPGARRVIVQNRGGGAERTSFVTDLDTGTVDYIGNVGLSELSEVAVVSEDLAYAIDTSINQLVRIRIDTDGNVQTEALPFGADARDIGVSPSGRFLYVSSIETADIVKVDLATETVLTTAPTPISVASHEVIFAPSQLPPFTIRMRGGDGQYFPPGSTLPTPLSVEVRDRNNAPIPNVPVFFAAPPESGLVFQPEQPSLTNSRGIATTVVTIPEDETDTTEGGDDAALGAEPGGPSQTTDPSGLLETLPVSATVSNLPPVLFSLTIVRGTGFIIISGDRQVTVPGEPFPKPIIVLASDSTGQPLPQDTRVTFSADAGAGCSGTDPQTLETLVRQDGLIQLECKGNQFPAGSSLLSLGGTITLSIPELEPRIGPSSIAFSVMGSGVRFNLSKQGGDDQTAATGTKLPTPLQFKVIREIGFGSPAKDMQVEVRQVQGSARQDRAAADRHQRRAQRAS